MDSLSSLSQLELLALCKKQHDLLEQQGQTIALLQEQVKGLKEEIARLKGNKPDGGKHERELPAFVKANQPAPANKPRKKRIEAFVRRRETPTQEIAYACSHCPDCGRALSGGSEYSRRQIIELPEIAVRIVDHVLVSRYCGMCRKSCFPKPDWSKEAVAKSVFGPQVHSLVAYLRQVGRLPIRTIATLLSALCHLTISVGEVVRILATVATMGKATYEHLKEALRTSPFVHGDETGWRENGQNGYLWSFSTPQICYFTYPKSRSGQIVQEVLGESYQGVLVSDFYSAYNIHRGFHQRCWVHLLRDVHELTKKFPTEGVLSWAKSLRELYDKAKAFQSESLGERERAAFGFQEALVALASGYGGTGLPQSTLCQRLLSFANELFTFVEFVGVPSENNAAERSIRPRVVARKISGGSRSPSGSSTMAVLSSLFATWQLQSKECLSACREMLREAQEDAPRPCAKT